MKRAALIFVSTALAAAVSATGQTAQTQAKPAVKQAPPQTTAKRAQQRQAPRSAPGLGAFKPAAKPSKQKEVQIPKDAQQLDASTWRATDANGTAWIYRRTPFGVAHYREDDEKQRALAQTPETNPAVVTDAGDSYKFVRTTPFGTQGWTKKKSDLTDSEKEMVKVAQTQAQAGSPKGRQ